MARHGFIQHFRHGMARLYSTPLTWHDHGLALVKAFALFNSTPLKFHGWLVFKRCFLEANTAFDTAFWLDAFDTLLFEWLRQLHPPQRCKMLQPQRGAAGPGWRLFLLNAFDSAVEIELVGSTFSIQ